MSRRYKPCEIEDCSRDYLERLEADMVARQARGEPINEAFLEQVRRAIPKAPKHFITHEL